MTTVQAAKDNVTKRLHRIARGIGLLAGAMALLVISSVAGILFLACWRRSAGPALSKVEGPALSKVEGPALSKVEGPALSKVEGRQI